MPSSSQIGGTPCSRRIVPIDHISTVSRSMAVSHIISHLVSVWLRLNSRVASIGEHISDSEIAEGFAN